MKDDLDKNVTDLTKEVERLKESNERRALENRAWNALDNALGTIRTSHDMYASTKLHLIDEAVKYLEAVGKTNSGKSAQPYRPTFLLHFAIAIQAMHMSPSAAQDLYKELGNDFITKYFG